MKTLREEILKLWNEYVEALKEHYEANETHRKGYVTHGGTFADFMDWLEKGFIHCYD